MIRLDPLFRFLIAAGFAGLAIHGAGHAATASGPQLGLVELSRLDRLPLLHPAREVGMVSSYDRTGGNDDGFSGNYSFVRKEGDSLVLAELEGPGIVYRLYTPTPTDDPIEFYFDGETTPRLQLPFRKFFDGSTAPFLPPITQIGSGGHTSYLPIPYAKSLKIVARAKRIQFYQINYATFSDEPSLPSFRLDDPQLSGRDFAAARTLLARHGQDVSSAVVPPGTPLRTARQEVKLAPGSSVTVLDLQRGGRIAGLRFSPASAFAGRDRAIVLRITWDGADSPAVLCPAGDFFGYSWGDPAARSLLVGTADDSCYAYFPMPFDRSARIELLSERTSGPPLEIQAEIIHSDLPRQSGEARFYAVWHRENPTTRGKPFTFVDLQGRGHIVGVTLQAAGATPGDTYFFEGDDRAIIDGRLAIHGTGSEDFFSGGWYDVPGRWESRASYPLTGCLDYVRPLGRTGGYRLFLGDSYVFQESITLDIEHWPTGNEQPTDHTGVTYFYLENPPATPLALAAASARVIDDPSRLVFSPGWSTPSFTFSIQNATVTKQHEKRDGRDHHSLSLRAAGPEVFGSQHHLALFCDVPQSGRYRVSIEMMQGPVQGIVELLNHSTPAGSPRSGHAAQRARTPLLPMGELELAEGVNRIYFRVTPVDENRLPFAFDLVTVELVRVR